MLGIFSRCLFQKKAQIIRSKARKSGNVECRKLAMA